MKIKITLKDPDGFYESVRQAVSDQLASIDVISDEEREVLEESRIEAVNEKLSKWVEFNEYIYLEFDTDQETARILEKS